LIDGGLPATKHRQHRFFGHRIQAFMTPASTVFFANVSCDAKRTRTRPTKRTRTTCLKMHYLFNSLQRFGETPLHLLQLINAVSICLHHFLIQFLFDSWNIFFAIKFISRKYCRFMMAAVGRCC